MQPESSEEGTEEGSEAVIKVEITRVTEREYQVTENFVKTRTPTEHTEEQSYGGRRTVVCQETFEPREVKKTTTETTVLLRQEIANEDSFDLGAVIQAINKIGEAKGARP